MRRSSWMQQRPILRARVTTAFAGVRVDRDAVVVNQAGCCILMDASAAISRDDALAWMSWESTLSTAAGACSAWRSGRPTGALAADSRWAKAVASIAAAEPSAD